MIEIIGKIVSWAQQELKIRAIILEGSIVSGAKIDKLSDYDLNIYITDYSKFVKNNDWMYTFDDVIVYQKPDFTYDEWYIPSRLVVYKHSPRVDFSFWNIDILKQFIEKQELPEFYKNGYKVLIDKDRITSQLHEPSHDGYAIARPCKDEFLKTIFDFWYEVYCVVKYLKRESLFYTKMIENGYIKKFLLQMLLWYEAMNTGWGRNDIHTEGKNLEEIIDDTLKSQLAKCFSDYSYEKTLTSLQKMIQLFEKYSITVCNNLDIDYPNKRIKGIKSFINKILT